MELKRRTVKNIYKEVSDQLKHLDPKLTPQLVEKIFSYQFGFLAKTIRSGDLKCVRIKHFGIFGVKDYNIKKLYRKSNYEHNLNDEKYIKYKQIILERFKEIDEMVKREYEST